MQGNLLRREHPSFCKFRFEHIRRNMVIQGAAVINLIIAVVGVMVCIFALLIISFGMMRDKKTATIMFCLFVGLLIYNICLLFLQLTLGFTGRVWKFSISAAGYGTFLYSSLCTYIVTNYILNLVSLSKRTKKGIRVILLMLLLMYIGMMLAMQFTGRLILVDENGVYRMGEASYLGYLMTAVYMIFDLVLLIRFGKDLPTRQKIVLGVYLGLPLLSVLARPLRADIYMTAMSSSMSVLIMLIMLVRDQAEDYRRQEEANEQLKIDILLSQIQPHFLFNVLYVIQEICYTNPEIASEAIEDFSMYLRHNMDSISISTPIPFKEELKHVKHYVALQQLRFGDALDVQYDLHCMDFTMPTLTLQPIVENAVRYGVRMAPKGRGTVLIQTTEYSDCYELVVKDNGPGFDEMKLPDDGMSHKGISNVRERLRHICGGELIVASEPGNGTTVTMILPKG